MSRRVQIGLRLLLLVSLLAGLQASVAPAGAWAQDPLDSSEGSLEERVLEETARSLGWPSTIERKPLRASRAEEETMLLLWPVKNAIRFFNKPVYTITNGGSYRDETIQYARVLPMGEAGSRHFIDTMIENGLSHSSYQGREGIVMRSGDQICDPGGLLGYLITTIMEWLTRFLEETFGPKAIEGIIEDPCAEADAGMIMWTCGSHVFIARDDTGLGGEDTIAAALYMAAERQSICDLGDTLVLMAGTDDAPNRKTIGEIQELAQDVNSYYGQNAYGRVLLSYTFLDADGDTGQADGYSVGPSVAAYADKEDDFAIAAVKEAFKDGAPREEVELSRIIVVYSGSSQQTNSDDSNFSTLCCWPHNGKWFDIEVGPDDNKAHVFAGSIIMVGEEDGLGAWAHEVGHSLYSQYTIEQRHNKINDRYNYSQPWGKFGNIDHWGLMGSGNWWGDPEESSPVHMSGFTKEAAEWLNYVDAELGKKYTLTAIEDQEYGGSVLRVDDPTSNDPRRFLILEARDSGAPYGAPESGVVLYQVSWDGSYEHYIVNAISAADGPTSGTGPGGRHYRRPTLRNPGDADAPTVRRWPAAKIEWRLESESTADGYSAVVVTDIYTPTNMAGATVAPAGPPAVPPPADGDNSSSSDDTAGCGRYLPMPDIDLHAYDDQGRHVGLNYDTGQYEAEIPDAEFSGDLKDAPEWIYVPTDTTVRFEVSAYKTEQFLQDSPQFRASIRPQEYEIRYQKIDEEGTITEARGKKGEIEAGEQTQLQDPGDPSLNYKSVGMPGYGRNLPGNIYLVVLLIAIVLMGLVGWVVALVRR
ncbi:MAG: hypothetical protein ACLFV5_05695 [Anaerolineales bacterium]